MIQRIPKSNILPQPTKYLEESFQMETMHSTPKIIQVRPIIQNNAFAIVNQVHKVDITEGASARFPTWIFNFRPYGQLRAEREKIHYELLPTFGGDFRVFMGIFLNIVASAVNSCMMKILFFVKNVQMIFYRLPLRF